MREDIYILGVGNNTIVYIDLAEACGYNVAGLYHYDDSRTGEKVFGYEILGSFMELQSNNKVAGYNFALSQGDNTIRTNTYNSIVALGGNIPNLIHPTAYISRFTTLGKGVVIHANCTIHPDTYIGNNTVFDIASTMCHSSKVEENCFVAPKALIGAYIHIDSFAFIGLGSIIISGKAKEIGKFAYIGAGSVVTKSVKEKETVIGNPAKTYIKKKVLE